MGFGRYWSKKASAGRALVDKYFNCEDVLMNHLYANASLYEVVNYVKPTWAIDTLKISAPVAEEEELEQQQPPPVSFEGHEVSEETRFWRSWKEAPVAEEERQSNNSHHRFLRKARGLRGDQVSAQLEGK
ncbi:unnamed protein product [Fraxinus pennsylvanica]|uniref:Glycosyl transferase 64 domain-containing protein n=1 Tax=Fraxinus pennsylvanica TaxID=56036 RepID=A0AAD2E669_9LAMI|nr:unnamed protein product [Fraxinus pennsylvanica]